MWYYSYICAPQFLYLFIVTVLTQEKAFSTKSNSYEIDIADLKFGDLLGRGGYGAVFHGRWKSKGLDVALKKVNCTPDASDAQIMMELGRHPNISAFYGFAYNYPETIIFTSLAKKGSLYDLLHIRKEKPTEQQSLTWAKQIAYGMAYMHEHDLVHLDLKSSNILFSDEMVAQVCDFGTSRFLDQTITMSVAGTPRWMAPEVAQNKPVNKQCDVFSFSLIVWEMMECKMPYHDAPSDVLAAMAIINGERPPISAKWPDYLSSLTQACWAAASNDRPTFSDIITSLENKTYFRERAA